MELPVTLYCNRAEPGRLMAVTTVGAGLALATAALAGGGCSGCTAATDVAGSGEPVMSATVAVLALGALSVGEVGEVGGSGRTASGLSRVVFATESIAEGAGVACGRGFFNAFLGGRRGAAAVAIGEGATGMVGWGAMLRVIKTLAAVGSSGGPMRAADARNTSQCAARTSKTSTTSERHGTPPVVLLNGATSAIVPGTWGFDDKERAFMAFDFKRGFPERGSPETHAV